MSIKTLPRFLSILRNPTFKVTTRLNFNCVAYIINRNVSYHATSYFQNRVYSVQSTPENMNITFEDVKSASLNKDILLIDVREPDEIKEHGKIPNSINIPLDDVTKALGTMTEKEFSQTYNRSKPTKDSPMIFYCMIGKRSGKAQQNAINLGYKQVKNYLGSWTDWVSKTKA